MRFFIYFSLSLFLLCSSLFAEVGLTSVPLLQRPASPVEAAYRGGGSAMGHSVYSMNVNPAVIGLQDYSEFYGSYETLPFGFSAQNIAYAKPLRTGTLGLALRYMGSPNITTYDDNFVQGNISAYDLDASAIYAFHFFDMSFGIEGAYVQSQLGDFMARTVSMGVGGIIYFDVPSIFHRTKNLNLGVGGSLKNLSPGIKYGELTTPLPMTYSGALYYNLTYFAQFETNLEFFFKQQVQTEKNIGLALEMKLFKYLVLRGGLVQSELDGSGQKDLNFTGGGSLLLSYSGYVYDISYSVEPVKSFGGLQHHFGMRVQFGGGEKYPFGMRFASKGESRSSGPAEYEYGDINDEDKVILKLLRNAVYSYQKEQGRYPSNLNEVLLFLNKYHIYEIPNPKQGKYRYNKRTGKLFIRT